jgi:hypothetical protein
MGAFFDKLAVILDTLCARSFINFSFKRLFNTSKKHIGVFFEELAALFLPGLVLHSELDLRLLGASSLESDVSELEDFAWRMELWGFLEVLAELDLRFFGASSSEPDVSELEDAARRWDFLGAWLTWI